MQVLNSRGCSQMLTKKLFLRVNARHGNTLSQDIFLWAWRRRDQTYPSVKDSPYIKEIKSTFKTVSASCLSMRIIFHICMFNLRVKWRPTSACFLNAISFHASLPGSSFILGFEHVEFSLREDCLCCFIVLLEQLAKSLTGAATGCS